MKTLHRGLAVALIHVLIVLSVGGKLLYDRATRPRVWVRVGSADPNLPIRGRYLTFTLQVPMDDVPPGGHYNVEFVKLAVENNQLVAHKSTKPTGVTINFWAWQEPGRNQYVLSPPLVFFLPEHADTLQTMRGELWAEVTVPQKGPPRPIQLAIKRGQEWTPLTYR